MPPAMIGPLATLEMYGLSQPPAGRAATVAPAAEPPLEAVESAIPLAGLSLERCATIAASIARRVADRPQILEENELTRESWDALNRRWTEAIRVETALGKTGLLRAYDLAYVAQLEKERGPITTEEHARLVVAAERRLADAVMQELGLPPEAFMRIRRLWIAKTAANAKLGAAIRQAIETEWER